MKFCAEVLVVSPPRGDVRPPFRRAGWSSSMKLSSLCRRADSCSDFLPYSETMVPYVVKTTSACFKTLTDLLRCIPW